MCGWVVHWPSFPPPDREPVMGARLVVALVLGSCPFTDVQLGPTGRDAMSLLSSLGQAFHRVGVQTSVPDRLGTVRLALEGWREEEALEGMRGWRDPDGTGLSLAFHDAPFSSVRHRG